MTLQSKKYIVAKELKIKKNFMEEGSIATSQESLTIFQNKKLFICKKVIKNHKRNTNGRSASLEYFTLLLFWWLR